ncbi:MAG: type IV pilus assembly protein PilM [Isosphaeraceae bacterium]|nr:type IV pilus assembly protein PilM [Isosphaeraceae bacterium]
MAKIQAVWALDIGQAALKALKLVPGETPDQVVAEAFDFVEYPKILSQPDADPEQLVREALETFLDRNDLKGCKVAIAVPGQAGLVKFIKLPPVEKKRIPDIVKFEARQQIPFALEEVVWAYQQIGDEDEGGGDDDFTMAEVGLFAMKRDQINRAILPFRNAGIEVDVVQMGPIALYNFITFDQIKGSESKDSVVLLDIGADNTDLIITDGTRIWQRNVPIGGNHFTRALTKELKLTFAKAEHLKRNATKAPDPRSIFTAMRGVFNDFASEINRSIGFYSSVNRTAKISKIVGMGNGFKLPGLQKFLQQNLSNEVDKLESFGRMVGDEVKTAPQFQENLASFAVAYGLGVQGLGRSGLRTNLLPPEIEQVRLIRAKKPWALVASAMLMLGFSGLFMGDYRVLAKVKTPEFDSAVNQAKTTSKTGAEYKSKYETAKTAWNAKYEEGKALVPDPTDRGRWLDFLKTLNIALLPDLAAEYHLDPNKPSDQPILDRLRIHVDLIRPVYRADVGAEWYSMAPPVGPREDLKNLIHALDRATPPTGKGWIVQIVGHHYNPTPTGDELKVPEAKRTALGPYAYIVKRIMPRLNDPRLRLYGISHVALGWMTIDRNWTSDVGSQTNNLSSKTVPLLERAVAAAKEGAGGMEGGMMGAMGKGMMGGGMGMMGGGMGPGAVDPRMMMGGMGMPGARTKEDDKKLVKLTRTDFLIQFVWQPKNPEDMPKTEEEFKTKLEEETKKLLEAQKGQTEVRVDEASVEKASLEESKAVENALTKPAAGVPGIAPGAAPLAPPSAGASPAAAPAATPK